MINVEPGTIAIYGDIACPWTHLATHRAFVARERLGLVDDVLFEMRAFPLELVNDRPTPRRTLDAEIPVAGGLDPDAGWQMWQAPDFTWPVTTLLALEAVQAANLQSLRAGEQVARALRTALFAKSRCVSIMSVVMDVAEGCDDVDARALGDALKDGRARPVIFEHLEHIRAGRARVSPHFFLPDGTDVANPGVKFRWVGEEGVNFPVVERDDPSAFERLLEAARR